MFKVGERYKYVYRSDERWTKDKVYKVVSLSNNDPLCPNFPTNKATDKPVSWSFRGMTNTVKDYWIRTDSGKKKNLPSWW